jgi:asparagine synthase (glutamine-hydrolysing)
MCGFAGILTTRGYPRDRLQRHVVDMSASLRHRGPDDAGVWIDDEAGFALGFRRLSIIDLSAHGHQPMRSASGRHTIAFNGEIYNYPTLRRGLEEAGVQFHGHSDTEVLLEGFETWGVSETLDRSVGMFAIALWDRRDRTLTLMRDRLGIKPLFLYWRPGMLLFGSELKALMCGPEFQRTIDRQALTAYFRYLHVPSPLSIFDGVTKLLPGHTVRIRDVSTRLPESIPYWSLGDIAERGLRDGLQGSEEEICEEADRVLRAAVTDRLHADVPVGAFLSGGIDSPLVVSLMQSASSKPVKTFTISFDYAEHDEAEHAAAIARYLETDHTELSLTAKEGRAVVPRLAGIFDEPFANASAIPNYLLCEMARRDVTVALAGTGGDEILAGYNRYMYGAELMRWLRLTPGPVRRGAARVIGATPVHTLDRLYRWSEPVLPGSLKQRLAGEKLRKLGEALGAATPIETYRSLISAWHRPETIVRGGSTLHGRWDRSLESDGFPGDWFDRLLLVDQLTYLVDDQLAMTDRVSMAVSLEVRVPLLDHRLVELSWRLPQSMKRRDRVGKWLLRAQL